MNPRVFLALNNYRGGKRDFKGSQISSAYAEVPEKIHFAEHWYECNVEKNPLLYKSIGSGTEHLTAQGKQGRGIIWHT